MNMVHFVTTFQLQATQSIKGDKSPNIASINQKHQQPKQILQEWKLPQKVNFIEKMLQQKQNEIPVRRQELKKNFEIMEKQKSLILFVGCEDFPHILALLYSILYLLKKNQTQIDKNEECQALSPTCSEYEENYLLFKYEIYLLAQQILTLPQTLILVQNMSSLYYCTQISNYLSKNQSFIKIFYKLFEFSSKSNNQQRKNQTNFSQIFNFAKKFPFLLCQLYDFKQSFDYFKQEPIQSQFSYDIMKISLENSKKFSLKKHSSQIYIVQEVKYFFVVHSQTIFSAIEPQTPPKLNSKLESKQKYSKANSIYSTPKFILHRSKNDDLNQPEVEIQVDKFDQQQNTLKKKQINKSLNSSFKKLLISINKDQSTQHQSFIPTNFNSPSNEDQNTRNLSPKYFGSSNNLTQIPQQISLNSQRGQINRKLCKINLNNYSRLAELMISLPGNFQKNKNHKNITSSNNEQKNSKNLLKKYQKKPKRHGPIYESLNVGNSLLENPKKSKIRETLNIKLKNYKNLTVKNITDKLRSPRENNPQIKCIQGESHRILPNYTVPSHENFSDDFRRKKTFSSFNQIKKSTNEGSLRKREYYSPPSIQNIVIDYPHKQNSSQTLIVTHKIITTDSPYKNHRTFPRKITFSYGKQQNFWQNVPQTKAHSLSPQHISFKHIYPSKKTLKTEYEGKWA